MQVLSNVAKGATICGALCFSGLLSAQSVNLGPETHHESVADVAALSLPDAPDSSSSLAVEDLPEAPTPANAAGTLHSVGGANSPLNSAFPDPHQRFKGYLAAAFGPGAFIAAGISAAVDQTHSLKVGYPADGFPGTGNHPDHGTVPEWGEGFDGYAKRYASRYGMSLVSTTTRYGLGEALHEDVSYHRCECTGTLHRTEHALEQSFIAHTASGKAVPSIPALVSPFVGAEVGVAGWYPARYNVSDALRTSTNLYISAPIQNLVNEFLRR